ncbi:hypothetical protein BN1708_001970 [Verticillium longisporum]|uniref:Uncharacterized protein n=1 Tax=Verticillium longisporum TaxID=100787 RepID=A0A0G4KDJ2_VERLO|nr:hypothetical protein BN1708_001970 [Verticillium longisporum]
MQQQRNQIQHLTQELRMLHLMKPAQHLMQLLMRLARRTQARGSKLLQKRLVQRSKQLQTKQRQTKQR